MHSLRFRECMDSSMLHFVAFHQSNDLLYIQRTRSPLRTPANRLAAAPRSTALFDLIDILDKTRDVNVPILPLADGVLDVGISACKAERWIADDQHRGKMVAHGGSLEMAGLYQRNLIIDHTHFTGLDGLIEHLNCLLACNI